MGHLYTSCTNTQCTINTKHTANIHAMHCGYNAPCLFATISFSLVDRLSLQSELIIK